MAIPSKDPHLFSQFVCSFDQSEEDLPEEEREPWIREQDCLGFRPSNRLAAMVHYDVRTRSERNAFPLLKLSQARELLLAP